MICLQQGTLNTTGSIVKGTGFSNRSVQYQARYKKFLDAIMKKHSKIKVKDSCNKKNVPYITCNSFSSSTPLQKTPTCHFDFFFIPPSLSSYILPFSLLLLNADLLLSTYTFTVHICSLNSHELVLSTCLVSQILTFIIFTSIC